MLRTELDEAVNILYSVRCRGVPHAAFDPGLYAPERLLRIEAVALAHFQQVDPSAFYQSPHLRRLRDGANGAARPANPPVDLAGVRCVGFEAPAAKRLGGPRASALSQDAYTTLETPDVRAAVISDGLGSSPQSEYASQLLVRIGALAAHEIVSDWEDIRSIRDPEFAARVNARIVRKLWEVMGRIQRNPTEGIPLVGDATLGIGIGTPYEALALCLGDSAVASTGDVMPMSRLVGREPLEELFVRVTEPTAGEGGAKGPERDALLARWPAAVQNMLWHVLDRLQGVAHPAPAAQALPRIFDTATVRALCDANPLDPNVVASETLRLSAAFRVLCARGGEAAQDEIFSIRVSVRPGLSIETVEARAFFALAARFVQAEAENGLIALDYRPMAECSPTERRLGLWTDGVRFVDPEALPGGSEFALRWFDDTQLTLRAEWLARHPERATEVVKIWNALAQGNIEPDSIQPTLRSEAVAVARLHALGVRLKLETIPAMQPIEDDITFAGF